MMKLILSDNSMMSKIPKYGITIFGWVAVLYPLWVRGSNIGWSLDAGLLQTVFPFLGLLMFSLLWLHALCGVFEPWLAKHINLERFVGYTAAIILACLVLHPLLLIINFNFNIKNVYSVYGTSAILLAVIGWCLLIIYDVTKPLKKKHEFFEKNWKNILTISTFGFLLTFFHSLLIGSDLQSGPLRVVWIFYGTTAILATIYTYGIKRFI